MCLYVVQSAIEAMAKDVADKMASGAIERLGTKIQS